MSDIPSFVNDTSYEQVHDLVELLADQARASLQARDGRHGHVAILSSTIQKVRATGFPVTKAAPDLDPDENDLLITLAERILALLATADREFPDRVERLEELLHKTLCHRLDAARPIHDQLEPESAGNTIGAVAETERFG